MKEFTANDRAAVTLGILVRNRSFSVPPSLILGNAREDAMFAKWSWQTAKMGACDAWQSPVKLISPWNPS
jgi:hypothetical protein